MTTTTILSDNGVSSGSAGIKTTGGNDGTLQLQTTTSGGTATTALTIDTSQNVGIGTSSPNNALQVNSSASTTKIQLTNSTTGSTASDGYEISMNGTDLYHVNRENGAMLFYTNGSERGRWNAGAPILCLAGGNTSATGTGIAFPASQSASSDANTLDDYEEGTWTPRITLSSGTLNSQSCSGQYVKIGRQVTLTFQLSFNTTSGNTPVVNDMPFTTLSGTSSASTGVLREQSQTGYFWGGAMGAGASSFAVYRYDNVSNLPNGAVSFVGTLVYQTN